MAPHDLKCRKIPVVISWLSHGHSLIPPSVFTDPPKDQPTKLVERLAARHVGSLPHRHGDVACRTEHPAISTPRSAQEWTNKFANNPPSFPVPALPPVLTRDCMHVKVRRELKQ